MALNMVVESAWVPRLSRKDQMQCRVAWLAALSVTVSLPCWSNPSIFVVSTYVLDGFPNSGTVGLGKVEGNAVGRQPWTSRLTVEECLYWDATAFRLAGVFDLAPDIKSSISWKSDPEGVPLGTLRFETWTDRAGRRAIHVPPQPLNLDGMYDHSPGQTVRLAVTRPHFGGERFWFICECGRQVGRLYLPPEEAIFRCRQCYELTYRSAQEHNTRAERDRGWVDYLQGLLWGEFRLRSPTGLR